MTTTDTARHALDLLDRAILLRMDPDPAVGIRADLDADNPRTIGRRAQTPELYVEVLCLLERAASHLGSLGWGWERGSCANCPAAHFYFQNFQWALGRVSAASTRRMTKRLDKLLDGRGFCGESFRELHGYLAYVVRVDKNAVCASIAQRKR